MASIKINIEEFKQYIHDSSSAIFSTESNKNHDWHRKMQCSVMDFDVPEPRPKVYDLLISESDAECFNDSESFFFGFDLLLIASLTKGEAREMVCRIADEMQFHPNIKVKDNGRSGDERHFCVKPKVFNFNQFTHDYCWDEVPERADCWSANIFMHIKMTPPTAYGHGRSFDLSADPVCLLREAIRERDEEIARKEADRKAKEEAERKAREKAWDDRQPALKQLRDFLESIGHFDINGVPFAECWVPDNWEGEDFRLCRGEDYLFLNADDGFDENLKKIIKWAVENGAREPESRPEAA